ncbi:MAG TPA: ATP-binding protein [Anaerolineae bacterium]|nr:ATP-binding protein [Anaerolineae bacterium]
MSSESDMDFFNLNPQGCLLTDMAGTIRQANPAACLLFGLPQNKLVDIPLVHLIDEADQNVFHCQLTRLRTEKRIEDWEVRLISTQSRPTYAKVVVTTVGNPPGQPEELLWFLCDITAHKETAAKISQHNQQLLTLQFVNAAIASNVDLQNMLDSVSRAMAKVLGVPACAISEWDTETNTVPLLLEYGPDDWWDDDLLEEVYEVADFPATKYVLMERQARQMTINQPNIDPDELRYMQEIKIKTLLMLPMEFQNRVVGLVELMDDRIERTFTNAEIVFVRLLANQAAGTIEYARLYNQIQQELGERILAEEELRQSEARNKALLDAIPDLVIQITRDGRCLNYKGSDSWDLNTVFGVEIGKNVTDLLPPDIADLMLTNINKTLQTGQMQIFEYQLKLPYGSQDYETRMVVNGPDEVIGIIQNITDRKRAEQKAIHEERLAALGQLVATLAHEMNNPLQAVQSHLDLVLNYALDPEKSRLHLNIIRSQIERLHAIMRPVLNLSRPRPTPPQPVVVAQLIEQVLILVDKNLEMNQLQVRTDFQETPLVLVVAEQLTQVFLNLILNAIEAAQPHSQLQIAIFSKDDAVMITFTNHGPSIPSEHMPHIFEPFYTTKSEGSGLGLWVSRNLIQQHGGILTAANLTDDEGVVFSVQLPSASIKELTF